MPPGVPTNVIVTWCCAFSGGNTLFFRLVPLVKEKHCIVTECLQTIAQAPKFLATADFAKAKAFSTPFATRGRLPLS